VTASKVELKPGAEVDVTIEDESVATIAFEETS